MSSCALRLVTQNLWMTAALTATPAITNLPNSQKLLRSSVAKTTSNTSQVIAFNLAAASSIDTVWIPIDPTATVLVQLYSGTNQTGALVYSAQQQQGNYIPAGVWRAGIDPFGAYQDVFKAYRPGYFEPVTALSGRITITSTTASIKTCPYIVIGKSWQPAYGANIGMTLGLRSSTQTVRTRGGSLIETGVAARWRELSLDLAHLSKAERVELYSQLITSPNGVMIDALPLEGSELRQQHLMLANVSPPDFAHNGSYHSTKLTLTEI